MDYNINGYSLTEEELNKITLPCLILDIGVTPIRAFQKEALDRIVTQSIPTRRNLQVGVAFHREGVLKWVGALQPDRIRFILSLLDHLDSQIITEEYGVISGKYIDAYIKPLPVMED